jgi:hypothetical protein
MNSKAAVAQLRKQGPPTRRRASHGQWVQPGEAVYNLVDAGWNVSDAVRAVVIKFKFTDEATAFNGVRAAYYVIRNRRVEHTPHFEI